MRPAPTAFSNTFTAAAEAVAAKLLQLRALLPGGRDSFEPRLRLAWVSALRQAGLTARTKMCPRDPSSYLLSRYRRLELLLMPHSFHGIPGTQISICGEGSNRSRLTVKPARGPTELTSRLLGHEVELGDPSFDAEFSVQGDVLEAFALLDGETRCRLAELLRGRALDHRVQPHAVTASLQRGELRVFLKHSIDSSTEELTAVLVSVLQPVLSLGRRLLYPKSIAARLAANVAGGWRQRDPEAGVRWRSLRLLLRHFPDHKATRQALHAARGDESEVVRIVAAIGQGRGDRKALLALMADPEVSDACAAHAAQALGDTFPAEAALEALRRALDPAQPELAKACLERLAQVGGRETEALALQALESKEAGLALAAAEALAKLGTAAAVPALREAGRRSDRELARAVRQAIAEIQARLTGAEQGQLSLAGSAAGALSLATEDEPGRLSLAEETERREPEGSSAAKE